MKNIIFWPKYLSLKIAKFFSDYGRIFTYFFTFLPKSCDLNPVDYYFWDCVKKLVYEGRQKPFENLAQLNRNIRRVWNKAINMYHLRKGINQFWPDVTKLLSATVMLSSNFLAETVLKTDILFDRPFIFEALIFCSRLHLMCLNIHITCYKTLHIIVFYVF